MNDSGSAELLEDLGAHVDELIMNMKYAVKWIV